MSDQSAPATTSPSDPWDDLSRHALGLAAALQALPSELPPQRKALCASYAELADEIACFAHARGVVTPASRPGTALTRKQLEDFGRLLRDKRNQAGLSRVQLAQRAKVSDVTIKFIETAHHAPSRATLLRLVAVPELGLRWTDTPGQTGGAESTDPAALPPAWSEGEFSRYDGRLSLPLVLESLLVLDELRAGLQPVEVTAYGARRLCCLCGARSGAWALDPQEAAKLPLQHGAPCAGQLADALWQRSPVLAALAQEERRSLRSPTATAIQASVGEIHRERFYGCRSGAELAAQLARGTGLTPTPYRAGVGATLLWALGLGPCPVGPTQRPFSQPRALRLAQLSPKRGAAPGGEPSRLRGVCDVAAWLTDPRAPQPQEPRV